MLCPDKLVCGDDITITTDDHGGKVMLADVPGTYWAFVWHGGTYVDVIRQSTTGTYSIGGVPYFYSDLCINVWDYDNERPLIEFGDIDEYVRVINEWIEVTDG
jgi:hypothetical protein